MNKIFRRTCFTGFSLVAVHAFSSPALSWSSWIGVLEDWPQIDTAKPEDSVNYEARVRPLFVRVDSDQWQGAPKTGTPNPAATLPKTFSWDVCFSGRGEGSVTAMLSDNSTSSAIPPYMLRDTDRAPWRTRRSLDYAGWITQPVYKPIVLSSSMNSSCKDPEKWKAGTGEKAKAHLAAMIAATNTELAKLQSKPTVQATSAKIPKAWGTVKFGRFAVLKAKTSEGKEIQATFYVGDATPAFIGFNTMMIDAGDFDGDGKSDLVFKQRGDRKRYLYALQWWGKGRGNDLGLHALEFSGQERRFNDPLDLGFEGKVYITRVADPRDFLELESWFDQCTISSSYLYQRIRIDEDHCDTNLMHRIICNFHFRPRNQEIYARASSIRV